MALETKQTRKAAKNGHRLKAKQAKCAQKIENLRTKLEKHNRKLRSLEVKIASLKP